MNPLTGYPERLIGNVARASLVAGLPAALCVSAFSFALSGRSPMSLAVIEDIVLGGLVGCAAAFLAGLMVVVPALALLRHFALGGVFVVYAIGLLISLPFFSNGWPAGLGATAIAGATSYAFCRLAYEE